jgi:hypothetical protein
MSRACLALAVVGVLDLFDAGAGIAFGQEPPAAVANDDDELQRLLEVRFHAASAVFARTQELYERGSANSSIEKVCDSFERFLAASVERAKSPAERVKVLENALLTAKQIDEKTRAMIERQRLEGPGRVMVPAIARDQAKYTVAQVEIDLIRARRAAATAAADSAAGK